MDARTESIIKADDTATLLVSDLRSALIGAPVAESIVIERLLLDSVSISQTLTRLRNAIRLSA